MTTSPAGLGKRNLGMTLERLRRMPPGEMVFRGRSAAGCALEEILVRMGIDPSRPPSRIPPAAEITGIFYFDPDRRDDIVRQIRGHHPEWMTRAKTRADTICGDPWFSNPRWAADPTGGDEWPRVFHTKTNIFSGDGLRGDIRTLWEINRHVELVHLAKAYFLLGDALYRRRCLEIRRTWAPQNPYGLGVNWTSALEVAMRALAWLWVHFFLGGRRGLNPADRLEILRGLHQHGTFVEKHLSEYFSPNNHLIGEATALFCLGAALPELPRAARWKRRGWDILAREAERQFHSDGGTVEQALGYHHFTLGLFLQATVLRRQRGEAIPSGMWDRLEKAVWFSLHLTRPDGRVPMIGDNDDAIACPAGEAAPWNYRHYMALGAALFGRPEFRWAAGDDSELAYWLLGEAGRERFLSLEPRPPEERSTSLPESGYCVMRSGWEPEAHFACLDCGPLGGDVSRDDIPSAGHGHADALSVEVTAFGKPILVDPGHYTYNRGLEWHRYFRETRSHNTLVVDGRSQSKFEGRMRWSNAAETLLETWSRGEDFDYAEASHDGYDRGEQPVRHRRRLFFDRSLGWILCDRLGGRGTHIIEAFLHFAPGVSLRTMGAGYLAEIDDVRLGLLLLGPEKMNARVCQGGEGPASGWIAPAYGVRQPACVASFAFRVQVPTTLWQVLYPSRDPNPRLAATVLAGTGGEALVLGTPKRTDLLFVSHDAGRSADVGRLATDARLVRLRRDASTGRTRGALLQGSHVTWDGRDLWRGPSSVERAAFDADLGGKGLDELAPALPAWTTLNTERTP